MLKSAVTFDELAASLAQYLTSKGVTSEYANEIAEALTREFATFEVPDPRPGTLSLLVGHYAIRAWHEGWQDKGKERTGQLSFEPMQQALKVSVRRDRTTEVVFDVLEPASFLER